MNIQELQNWAEEWTEDVHPEFKHLPLDHKRSIVVAHIIEELGEAVKEMRKLDGRKYRDGEDSSIKYVSEEIGDVVFLILKLYSLNNIKCSESLQQVKEKLEERRRYAKSCEPHSSG